jgi:DNA ligase (NAD+)
MTDLPFSIPDFCPACSSPTVIQGDFLYCKSKHCSAKLPKAVKVWVDRLGLLYWGDALIEALTNDSRITDIHELYDLSVDDLANYCSGMKVAQKCYDTLHASKTVPLELLLSAVNIPNFGIATATDIVQAGFDTVERILDITFDELTSVPNVGEITARQILDGLNEKRGTITNLSKVLTIQGPVQGSLQNIRICITGELWAPRAAVQKLILEAGGIVQNSVSKTTTYLVCDAESGTSKLRKARKLGVEVINGASLRGKLGL